MNFYLRLPYFLMCLCELGTENLHIKPSCKYQINQNLSRGSHSVVQGLKEKIKYFSKYFLRSELNPVRNMFTTICCVTVRLIKIGELKDIIFWGARGHITVCSHTHSSIYVIVSPTWKWPKGITETCGGWSNQMNVLCSDVVFVWI